MPMKSNDKLTPAEVIAMSLSQFERRFGFRPIDALDKKWFAVCAKRITPDMRLAIEAGVIGEYALDDVVME